MRVRKRSATCRNLFELVDRGVRARRRGHSPRKRDVVKPLTLGAKPMLTGRHTVHGWVIGGEAGVVRVLRLLRHKIDTSIGFIEWTRLADINGSVIEPETAPQ